MKKPLNVLTARGFGVVLAAVGGLGFLLPESMALTSGAPAYNVFHLSFAAVGVGCSVAGLVASRAFTIGFGVIDLYQAVASLMGWFPMGWFAWKPADDVLHVVIGAALVAIGVLADRGMGASSSSSTRSN